MPELADIFRLYGDAYLKKFGEEMLPSHRRAFDDIMGCRTEAMGGHVYRCDHCGREHYVYHSCKSRSCPKCHKNETEEWLDARRAELLPVPYFHLVFTIPNGLREILRANQNDLYGILIKAAAMSIIKLAADPHYVGGLVGVLSVLHTWGRTLVYHTHVHCLVPGGGISPDRKFWIPSRKNFFLPVKALSKIFRGIFLEMLGKQRPDIRLPRSVRRQKWVVHCEPVVGDTDIVLGYLARYVHRIAIDNSRILSISGGKVTFRYKDTRDSKWKTMTLCAEEFIRRFLQHVLPRGFHKVRYYGLWAPANRHLLHQLQIIHYADNSASAPEITEPNASCENEFPTYAGSGGKCPYCGKGTLRLVRRIFRRRRAPP